MYELRIMVGLKRFPEYGVGLWEVMLESAKDWF
jgi:hypothetical protein